MNTQHTPAPWEVEIDGTCSGASYNIIKRWVDPKTGESWSEPIAESKTAFVRDHEKEPEVAVTYSERPELWKPYEGQLETEANARLIAAAPTMLTALLAAQQCINDMVEAYKNDCSRIVLDEAVKSLRDDAGKLVNQALKLAQPQ